MQQGGCHSNCLLEESLQEQNHLWLCRQPYLLHPTQEDRRPGLGHPFCLPAAVSGDFGDSARRRRQGSELTRGSELVGTA